MKKTLFLAAAMLLGAAQAVNVTVRDTSGRSVTVPQNPQRVVLGEGRLLYSTAILDREDPFKRLYGWAGDLIKNGPDAYAKYKAKFPDSSAKVRDLGASATNFSVEQLIADKVDLVILTESGHATAKEGGLLDRLDKAKIPYVFVDFREEPLVNSVPSMDILGKIFGKQARATEFNRYYTQQLNLVKNRVAKTTTRPLVFMDRAAGSNPETCCMTFGPYNFGKYVEVAGGKNWGSTISDKFGFDVSPETIIKTNPEIIIATGADWANSIAAPLGYEAKASEVDARMTGLTRRTGFSGLKAVQNKQFYAVYHQFYNSPYHVFAIQQIAKWLHPEQFRDVNPEANFIEMHRRFLPVDYSGQFWAQLK